MKAGFSIAGIEPTTRFFAFLLGWTSLFITIAFFLRDGGFHDLSVYTDAVAVLQHGGDPYTYRNPHNGFVFIYAPLVLHAFAALDGNLGWALLLCYAAVLLLLLKPEMRPVALGILIAAAGMIFVRNRFGQSVRAGNVAVFLHLTIIFLWLRYGRHGRDTLFYVAVLAAALIKPFFLAYAVVPLLCGAAILPVLVKGFGVTLGTAAVWLAQRWLWPDDCRRLLAAMAEQILGKDGHAYSGDLGLGFYRLGAFAFDNATVAMGVHVVLAAGFVAVWYVINRRNRGTTNGDVLASLSALAVAILVNPRLKVYDDGIMTPLLFGYYYLATNALTGRQAKWVFWTYVGLGSVLCNIKTIVKRDPTDFLADGFLVYYPVFVITALIWLATRPRAGEIRPA